MCRRSHPDCRATVVARVRPIYPIAVRIDGFFKAVNPLWWPYLRQDVVRTAEMLGMPFAWPEPDPIVMNRQTGEVAKAQCLPVRSAQRRQHATPQTDYWGIIGDREHGRVDHDGLRERTGVMTVVVTVQMR